MKFVKFMLAASALAVATLTVACNNSPENKNTLPIKAGITKTNWGTVDGKNVYLYTLVNDKGDTVTITNYGGTITSFVTPDKNGKFSSVIIGFDSLAPYLHHPPYFGALIGRYGNRIGDAKFTLDGKVYTLAANDGKNTLHGGMKGFDKVVWDASILNDTVPSLTLKYLSKDGEEGFPGNLNVTVQYILNNDGGLKIEYSAETDKPTPVNLTNHSYFNLSGNTSNTILDETLMINADSYTPVDNTLIPTGEIKSVKGTPFDFTTPKRIGKDFADVKGGYDHNFVLNRKDSTLEKVASLSDSISGRTMDVYTTQPGLQFYTGNFLDGRFTNHGNQRITAHSALAMETQHFPDSPNKPNFPSTILKPGQVYHEVTIYQVSVK